MTVQEFYEQKSGSAGEEYFIHSDEFNEKSMPDLGGSSGEPLESEKDSVRSFGVAAKVALVAVAAALLVMQVFHPRWMLIPDPVRESIGIGKHVHTPSGVWVVDHLPTCTLSGYEYMTCTECGQIIDEKTEPAKGHVITDEWVLEKEPTCVGLGEEVRKCTVCGEILQVRGVPALGHKKGKEWIVTKKPTCTEKGEEVRKCTVCGEILEKRTVAATGHMFGSWTVIEYSTCVKHGSEKRKCSVCGFEETREKSLLSHNYVLIESVAATCTSSGYRLYECTMCGNRYRETIPATGHYFEMAYSYTRGPYAYCSRCGDTAESLGYRESYEEYDTGDGGVGERMKVFFPDGSYVYAY